MFNRSDVLVGVLFVLTSTAALGMLFDVWRLVYYCIPAAAGLFMVMGSLSRRDTWSPALLTVILTFTAILAALFFAADVTLSSDATVGGLPLATGIMVYILWPYSVLAGGLIYTWSYQRWLRKDNEDIDVAVGAGRQG